MRITNRAIAGTVLQNLARNLGRLEKLQGQLTSGKRLTRPSDDPPDAGRALTFRAGLTAGKQYLRNIDNSLSWLSATETNLASMTTSVQRARDLATQGSNSTLRTDQMQSLGVEVNQIIEQLVVLGNSSLRGQRLFAGQLTDADPFTMVGNPPTAVNYTGDSGQLLREFDVNATMAINVPGNSFLPAILSTLIDLRDDLNSGNAANVGSDLGAIDSALDSLLAVRSQTGAKVNRLESARERQEDVQVRLTELLSKVEDTDYTVAVSEFSLQETVYKAGLAAGSRALQPSLLDYIK